MPLKKSGPSRKARLESLLHREIATCVQSQLRDPRIGFVTVTKVELSADLHQVKAYYTVFGTDAQRRLAANALANAAGFVQRAYAPVVKTRLLPLLTFAYDDIQQRSHGMDDLIRQARATDSDSGTRPEPAAPEPKPE